MFKAVEESCKDIAILFATSILSTESPNTRAVYVDVNSADWTIVNGISRRVNKCDENGD